MANGRKTGGRTAGTSNKATAEVKAVAEKYTEEAVGILAKIMRASESDAARVSAVKEILDRGHGKSRQPIDANVNGNLTIQIVKFADTPPSQ